MGFSSVIGASSVIRPGVCTSTTRPASPYDGQVIYETDTDLVRAWDGTTWELIGPTEPGSWQAWTPTLTGWTLGNGTVTARYWQANKTVLFEGVITWGSTTSASGLLTVSLPVTASKSSGFMGVGQAVDASVRFYQVFVSGYSTTTFYCNVAGTNNGISGILFDAGGVTNTSPFTWVNTDRLIFQGMYEAA